MDLPDLGSYKQSLFPLSPRPSDGHLPISLFGQSPFPCLEFSRCAVCSLSGKFSEVSFTLSLCHPLPVAHFPRVATLWRWESKQSMGKRMRGASRARVQGRVGREPTCHAGESKKKMWDLGSGFLVPGAFCTLRKQQRVIQVLLQEIMAGTRLRFLFRLPAVPWRMNGLLLEDRSGGARMDGWKPQSCGSD